MAVGDVAFNRLGLKVRVYVAGPMRGIELFNYPAFDSARDLLESQGWEVVSPADLNRQHGLDETDENLEDENVESFVLRDVAAILGCDAIALLEGWEQSPGARAELAIAQWLEFPVISATTGELLDVQPVSYQVTT